MLTRDKQGDKSNVDNIVDDAVDIDGNLIMCIQTEILSTFIVLLDKLYTKVDPVFLI